MEKISEVILISPINEQIKCNYWELEAICKEICYQENNYPSFLEFAKDYQYFNPYFDFVMFELDYVLANPLCQKGFCITRFNNALYSIDPEYCENLNYSEMRPNSIDGYHPVPFMTRCSNKELDIHPFSLSDTNDVMVDFNRISMMSHSGTRDESRGSHLVTSRTVLNQLLSNNQNVTMNYMQSFEDVVNYLIVSFGFLRVIYLEEDQEMSIIGNSYTVSQNLFNEIEQSENSYFHDISDDFSISFTDEYSHERRGKNG